MSTEENNSSNFDGVIRCDITSDGVSMTWNEYKHVEAVNKNIASNPWNHFICIILTPWYLMKMFCVVAVMAGAENKFVEMFVNPQSRLSRFVSKFSKRLMKLDKYMDDEYRRIMEVPFWERHPERYTKEYVEEYDKEWNGFNSIA